MLMNVLTEVITVIPMPHALILRVALHVLATQATAAMESFVKVKKFVTLSLIIGGFRHMLPSETIFLLYVSRY